tara:strand:+ start:707 stop:1360 length:654 start_codon:yes stop_codon:yes gene_type:complete
MTVKPYFQDDDVVIYHGDCRDILPTLGPVDLVLTDPPYGMQYHSGHYKYGNPHAPIEGDNDYPLDILDMCFGVATSAVFAFCRWDNLFQLPVPKSLIVWVKDNWSAGDLEHAYGRMWEAVAFYPQSGHKFINRPHDVIQVPRVPPTSLSHPTEKPLGLIQRLFMPHEGETILDPFMGSGTTLRAAKDLGRRAIGIEVEERYCEIAARRMSQSVMVLV